MTTNFIFFLFFVFFLPPFLFIFTGHYPSIRVSPEIVHFGIVAIGYESAQTFTLTNTGQCPISWNIPYCPNTIHLEHLKSRHELLPKHSEEIGLTICPMKRGWFNHELMICAPDMSSHRMVTITGEAHVMKLVIAPLHVQLNEYDNNEGSFELFNEGNVELHLKIGQGLSNNASVGMNLSSSFGPEPGHYPLLTVNHRTVTLKSKERIIINFEIDAGPTEQKQQDDFDDIETMSTTIDILSPETSWVIQVTGIVRTKCENTPEPVTMNDTLEMFDQNLVYNDNLEEGEKVDVE